ncbi:MAG: aminotransferase class IV [Verrucomicrobiae bacterium]|nr:aminotransferase class IV [Verrucomicrobiae bacterium]
MKAPFYFCNGNFVPADQPGIFPKDLGLVRGYGILEFLRFYEGVPFQTDAHLRRLWEAIKYVRLPLAITPDFLQKVIVQLVEKNRFSEAMVCIVMTGGVSTGFLPERMPSLIVTADPFEPFPPWQYKVGISLMSAPASRTCPEIKSTGFFSAIYETLRAKRLGFDELVYVDGKGDVLEGTTFNVFAVAPGPSLVTPEKGVLSGITAACVIRLAKDMSIPVRRSPISRDILRAAKEVFITSTCRELTPVIRVDDCLIGKGHPGPLTRSFHLALQEMIRKENASARSASLKKTGLKASISNNGIGGIHQRTIRRLLSISSWPFRGLRSH